MSLLICTPIHGESVAAYDRSMRRVEWAFVESKLDYDVVIIEGESLIQRARNNGVYTFLQSRFQKLLFIDSDIEFLADDILKLWNLDVPICCGSYPFKRLGLRSTCWKDKKLVDVSSLTGPTEIDYAATGFLLIDRKVLEDMVKFFPEREHMEGVAFTDAESAFKNGKKSFTWFDPRISKGETAEERIYLSEDYAFSEDVRDMGYKIILDPSIRLTHWGMMGFK